MFFLELSSFFDNPVDVGNLISGSSACSKTSLNIWNFMVHILLKPGLENFKHYFTSVWDECNCAVGWAFFGITFGKPVSNSANHTLFLPTKERYGCKIRFVYTAEYFIFHPGSRIQEALKKSMGLLKKLEDQIYPWLTCFHAEVACWLSLRACG